MPFETVPHSDTSDVVAQMPDVVQRALPGFVQRSHVLPFQPATVKSHGSVAEHTDEMDAPKQPSAVEHWLTHVPVPAHALQTVEGVLPAQFGEPLQQYFCESNDDADASQVDEMHTVPLGHESPGWAVGGAGVGLAVGPGVGSGVGLGVTAGVGLGVGSGVGAGVAGSGVGSGVGAGVCERTKTARSRSNTTNIVSDTIIGESSGVKSVVVVVQARKSKGVRISEMQN